MLLKRLEIQGFKSFPEKIKLDFKEGITAIVGPNGSGKSNIADAIRWVIGEQSAKNLRGQTMEDIIFNGTKNRKPLGFSEVSIVLDNSTKNFKIDFDEVIITRKLYRSGESSFYINGSSCRLKDIQELFMDTGIGKEGYSIIGQGKIDSILSNKLEDRRVLFEEAVGIVKFKNRKNQAESKLNETQKNLIRVNDIISEIEAHLEPLKIQAEKTKEYLNLYENLKFTIINLFVYNYKNFEENTLLLEKDIKSSLDQINNLEEEKEKINNLQNKFKNNLEKLEKESQNLSFKLNEANLNISENKKKISLNLNSIEFIKNEVSRLEDEIKNLDFNISSKKESINLLKTELKSKKIELSVKKSLEESLQDDFKNTTIKFNENTQIINDYNLKIFEKLQKFNSLKEKITEVNLFKNQFKDKYNDYLTEINLNKSLIKEKETRNKALLFDLDSIKIKENEIKQGLLKKEELFSNLSFENKELLHKKEGLNSKNISLKNKIDLLYQLEEDFTGYNNSVKCILNEIKNGTLKNIFGAVIKLISVSEKFETAIEIALGSYAQNIVTKTEKEAKNAIEYLKKNNKGRATFLPISSIKPKFINNYEKEKLLKETGALGIASELINFDEKYFNIISYILGRVIIFDNIDNAIKFSKKYKNSYKIVTLEGDVINTNGSLTGGSNLKKQSTFLSRNREIKELEAYILTLKNQINEINSEYDKNSKEIQNIRDSINKKSEELQKIQVEKVSLNIKIEENFNYLQEIKSKIDLQIRDLENYENDLNKSDSNLENYENDLHTLEAEINDLKNKLDFLQKENQEQTSFNNEKHKEITNLKIEINSILHKISTSEQEINRIQIEIEENTFKKSNLNLQLNKNNNELQQFKNKNQKFFIEIENFEEEYKKINNSYENIQNEKAIINRKVEANTKKYIDLTTKISNVQNEKVKLELKKQNLDENVKQLADDIWEKYEVTYATACEKYFDANLKIDELKDNEKKLKNKINSLGQVNILAIDEYNSLKERYNTNIVQRDDILKADLDLREIIKNLTSEMEGKFKEQFKLINENFSSVFSQIFGGGTAKLVLTDTENILESNIEIIAQPPGKRLQSLVLLSGGERTLTALSLLFAILKLKPSPFCILDETEAALDDSNVIRYANFLKNFSKENQFIVITHKVGTMEIANVLYGVTMEEQGISKLVSVNLN